MKQSLDFRLGQHLTITPQLQQAIRLLQLSTVELQQEIQQALESNPLLEAEDGLFEEGPAAPEGSEAATETAEPASDTREDSPEGPEPDILDSVEWESSGTGSGADDEDLPDIEARNSLPVTLQDHLLWQLQMSTLSDEDRFVATALIDSIDEHGYLTSPLAE
ncbi:MAG TPA: RNA polymerase factor sigma-54, partial [Acidiferrobacteraceae bacterium]|nr:RNA polymerase factor sigma-54 [Acidiferrobacteraceae bacterium]